MIPALSTLAHVLGVGILGTTARLVAGRLVTLTGSPIPAALRVERRGQLVTVSLWCPSVDRSVVVTSGPEARCAAELAALAANPDTLQWTLHQWSQRPGLLGALDDLYP